MSKLKKGDLVMTEDGLAWYVRFYTLLGYRVILISGNYYFVEICLPATRTQVEAKTKDMGWYINQWEFTKQGYKVWRNGYAEVQITTPLIGVENFETAPARLNEAILVARLLNATKENAK
jgi:hypothetical protein